MLGYVGNGRIGLVGQKPHRLGHTAVADIVAEALAKALVENTRQVGTVEWQNAWLKYGWVSNHCLMVAAYSGIRASNDSSPATPGTSSATVATGRRRRNRTKYTTPATATAKRTTISTIRSVVSSKRSIEDEVGE